MRDYDLSSKIMEVEHLIDVLSDQLVQAQKVVQQWTDTNAELARNAAEARAKNQGMGRGILGSILGSKYRGTMRHAAAASNAAIAKEVAQKRAQIANGKREAQELVRNLKEKLHLAKQELKMLNLQTRSQSHTKSTVKSISSLDLLQQLKEAHDAGLLTDVEYEEKRKKLVSEI